MSHPWSIAWLALVPFLVIRAGTFAESDTFWEIRTGFVTLHRRAIPSSDPFSWTANGHQWTLNSWAFNVVEAAVYRIAGLAAVAVLSATLGATVIALVLVAARRLGAAPTVAGGVVVASTPLLTAYLSARPQVVDYIAVLCLTILLREIVYGSARRWHIAAAVVLAVVWVNLHAGILFGVGIAGAATLAVGAQRSSRSKTAWMMAVTAVLAIGAVVNPYGLGVIGQTMHVMNASTAVVIEWRHPDPTNPLHVLTIAIGIVALALAARRRDAVYGPAIALGLIGALSAIRMLPILVVLALPMLATELSNGPVVSYITSRKKMLVQGALIFITVEATLAVGALTHLGRPNPNAYSTAAIDHIPAGCHVLNTYDTGGLIILRRPDVAVSIDSRTDLYGSAIIEHQLRTFRDGASANDADLQQAQCVLAPPTTGLAKQLVASPDWRVAYADRKSALFVRR
jgi:hypothetical protein